MSLPDITITRYRADARRCGASTGAGPAWSWGYVVHCDGTCDEVCRASSKHDIGRGQLATARAVARRIAVKVHATRIREAWGGGKTYLIGPRGGMRPAQSNPHRSER